MKQAILLYLTAILLIGPSSLSAQLTITNASFPQLGDSLRTATDNLPGNINLGNPAGMQSWDFTTLQSPFLSTVVLKPVEQAEGYPAFPDADFVEIGEQVNTFYRRTANRIEVLGFFGQDPVGLGVQGTFKYEPPLIEQRAPMNYQDTYTSTTNISYAFDADDLPGQIFDGLPISPDSIRIRLNSQRTDEVDAWGTITLPGGIYDVLREKRSNERTIRIDAKVGFFNWFDITDILLEQLQLEALEPRTFLSYRFVSNQAKVPVAEVFMGNQGNSPAQVTYVANSAISNLRPIEQSRPGVYAYPNPAIVNVRFDFTNLPRDTYTLRIYNILGIEEWSQRYSISGNHTEKVNISALRKGTYFYSLANSQGRTIVTHRLIVVRP